jgi:hypothetical protein
MVQKLKIISSFNPPLEEDGYEEEDELESVECFSVDSLEAERKTQKENNGKTYCKQNGHKI